MTNSPPLDSDYAEQRRSRTRTGTIVASDDKYLSRGGPILDRSRPRSHSAAPAEIADRDRLERTPSQRGRYVLPAEFLRIPFLLLKIKLENFLLFL